MIDLTGLKLIREHIELDTVDSTNTYALNAARPGLLVTARSQTEGRGRQGRRWFSPPTGNIYMTLTLPAPDPRLCLVAGAAVRETLAGLLGGVEVRIKWPNDILILGRKVCGILCEARGGVAALGIGVNVNQSEWPAELTDSATSLKLVSLRALPLDDVLQTLVAGLDRWLVLYRDHGFEPVRAAFLEHGPRPGSPGRLEDGTPCVMLGLSAEGFLEVEVEGRRRTIISGDVAPA